MHSDRHAPVYHQSRPLKQKSKHHCPTRPPPPWQTPSPSPERAHQIQLREACHRTFTDQSSPDIFHAVGINASTPVQNYRTSQKKPYTCGNPSQVALVPLIHSFTHSLIRQPRGRQTNELTRSSASSKSHGESGGPKCTAGPRA